MDKADEFRQIGNRIRLEHPFGARGCGYWSGMKFRVDFGGNRFGVGTVGQVYFQLGDRAGFVGPACPL